MKNIICLCCTYFQLIIVLQMKETIFKNDNISVILTDDSKNSKEIYKNIKEMKIFKDIFFYPKAKMTHSRFYKFLLVKYLFNAIFGNKYFCKVSKKRKYDIFMFYNYDLLSQIIFSSLTKYSYEIQVATYEEGFISYEEIYEEQERKFQYKFIKLIKKMMHKRCLYEEIYAFYCFLPAIYKGSFSTIEIPKIDINNKELTRVLAKIFNINEKKINYDKKVIYFSTAIDFENGEENAEVELVDNLAKLLGKENIMIKIHPRDNEKRFTKLGVEIDNNSFVPFEIMQLMIDFSDKIFLTTMSGSVLTISSIVDNSPPIIYLYPLYGSGKNEYVKHWSNKYKVLIQELNEKTKMNIRIVDKYEELLKLISAL